MGRKTSERASGTTDPAPENERSRQAGQAGRETTGYSDAGAAPEQEAEWAFLVTQAAAQAVATESTSSLPVSALADVIWRALAATRLLLHYQPIVDLEDRRVVALEALLRIRSRSPHSTEVSVVSAGEHANHVNALAPWVVARACEEALPWTDRSVRTLVNMSPLQLAHPGLREDTEASLERTGLMSSSLAIEITEVAPLTPAASAAVWNLHDMGISFVLDDYGTGVLDVTAVRDLPISTIKIDHAVIRHLRTGTRRHHMMTDTVSCAHRLGMAVVAEGIETEAEAEAAAAAGCDMGQGFLFSRPLPRPAATALIAASTSGTHHGLSATDRCVSAVRPPDGSDRTAGLRSSLVRPTGARI